MAAGQNRKCPVHFLDKDSRLWSEFLSDEAENVVMLWYCQGFLQNPMEDMQYKPIFYSQMRQKGYQGAPLIAQGVLTKNYAKERYK